MLEKYINIQITKHLLIFAIVLIGVFGSIQKSQAATINAASCERVDVQSAQSTAVSGDVISIPRGTCSWTSKLPITKAVTFQGQPDGATVIRDYGFSSSSGVNNWRVTQINFESVGGYTGGSGSGVVFEISGNSAITIDNCQFKNYGAGTIHASNCQGVIANNLFVNGNNADALIYIHGQNRGSEERAEPSYFGQPGKFLFLEDNEFRCAATSSFCSHAWMTEWGGSVVARCNLVDDEMVGQASSWDNPFDMHNYGLAGPVSNGTQRAAKEAEIYGNRFVPKGGYPFDSIWVRGGSARIFENVWEENVVPWDQVGFHKYSGGEIYFREHRATAYDYQQYPITKVNGIYSCSGPQAGQCTAGSGTCCTAHEGYPCCDTIGAGQDWPNGHGALPRQASSPVYLWNNKDTEGKDVVVDHDHGLNSDQVLQSGREYIKSSVAPSGYAPYVYPHPLRNLPSAITCLTDGNSQAKTGVTFWTSSDTAQPASPVGLSVM